jgi:non-heme chloroperoxidase
MSTIEVGKDRSGKSIELFYQDVGAGKPVVLIHGWPVSQAMWEYQTTALAEQACRVISYDRRGFGRSCKPWDGYDYDTLADDLNTLLEKLDLNDVTLVGFSMGGGEVARYMGRHGGKRVGKIVLVSAVTPYLLKTSDNPDGVEKKVFDDILENIHKDWPTFLQDFGKQFFGATALHHPVSQAVLDWNQSLALQASLRATIACAHAFAETDFRADLKKITVPTLIIHGGDDKTVPIDASGRRTAKMIASATFKIYDGAPHGLFITHKDQLNSDLLAFIGSRPAL